MTSRFPVDDPDRRSHLEQDAEFARDAAALRGLFTRYRDEVVARVEPSPQGRQALDRAIVKMVLEDVERDFREQSLGRRLRRVAGGFLLTWRELLASSRAFRWTSQGALAFGVGLLLALILDVRQGAAARDAERDLEAAAPHAPALLLPQDEDDLDRDDVLRLRDALPGREPVEPMPRRPR